jgi:hypothetical protein
VKDEYENFLAKYDRAWRRNMKEGNLIRKMINNKFLTPFFSSEMNGLLRAWRT